MADTIEQNNKYPGIKLEEMVEAGLHFGHRTSKIHPKMMPYISTSRNNVHIINLEKTAECLNEALEFLKQSFSSGKVILIVGTKVQAKNLVKEAAIACGLPYITERWLGGTFTNFKTIQKRLEHLKDLKRKKETGELNKYTKRERGEFDKELKDAEVNFGGIMNLEKIPDVIFVFDMKKDLLAIKEAKKKGVKIIAVSDTNTDPTMADYPIPANDDSVTSIKYILNKIKEVIIK
jgi:small subunit ribosomal protein S2